MKKIIIILLTLLLVVSLIFNFIFYFKLKMDEKSHPIAMLKNVANIEFGSAKAGIVVDAAENEIIIVKGIYEPATPANWHKHSLGQVIFVLDGEGYYKEEFGILQKIKKGDIIVSKPNVKNWHGSTKNSKLVILGISKIDNKILDWYEPVTIEEYNNVQ